MNNIQLDSSVKNITYEHDKELLGVLTGDGSYRVLDADLKTISGFKTHLSQENDFRQTQCISNDLKYIALAKPNTNQAILLDTTDKKALYKISKNSGEVETLFINNTNKYLVSGGIDGRTYIFNLQNGHFLYNLPSHADYVTAIAITNTTQLVATGSFDGTVYITNLSTLKNPIKYRSHKSYICGIEFLNKGKIVSAEKNGDIIIYDFVQRKVKKRLQKVPDDITKIKVDPQREFLFVGTKLGRILVYDLTQEKLFSDNLRKYDSAITEICITQDAQLFVGLQNGYIYQENLIDEAKYNELYQQNDYLALYNELERSPFVVYSDAYQKMEQKWKQTLLIAKDFLSQQRDNEAKQILEPFNKIPKKRTIIKTTLSEFEEFEKFKTYVDNKKYSLAYPLTLKYKSLIDTKEYRKMEHDWSKKFNKAQDIILDSNSDELVQDLLKDFRGVPSKTKQIQQILKDKVVFDMFKKRLDSQNYKEIFNFIKQYPFLKETDAYETLTKYADSCYTNLTKALSNLDLLKAKEYIEILEHFDDFEDDIKDIRDEITLLIQLVQYCKDDNKPKIYEIIDSLDYDVELDCVKKVKQEWEDITDQASILAFKGNTKGLLELFKSFFIIKSKSTVIKKYILSAYTKKLEFFMKKATKDDEKTKALVKQKIFELNDLFGTIEEIRSILYTFNTFYNEDLAITNEKPEQHVTHKMYKSFFQ